jgi:hypothetical protein
MDIIHIKEPWYSAGKFFKWQGKTIGFSIKWSDMIGDGKLRIRVGNNPTIWIMDKSDAREFATRYNTKNFAKEDGTELWALPWHMFNKEVS